jgi:hypothetical protein
MPRAIRGRKYRSRLEAEVARKARSNKIPLEYEPFDIDFVQPAKKRKYKPDFVLQNGVIVEVKGRLTLADRQKMVMVRDQHPELDIRFVFKTDNWLTNAKKNKYSDWCEANGFQYAFGAIPKSWQNINTTSET